MSSQGFPKRARSYLRASPCARVDLGDRYQRENPDLTGEHAEATQRFVRVVQGVSIEALLPTLAPKAVLTSDGGGKFSAIRRAVIGREWAVSDVFILRNPDKVARL